MLYRFAKLLCTTVLVVLRRWEIRGRENFPLTGGLVLMGNHISYWDPVVIGCAIPRKISFMAKAELFDVPVLAPIIRKLGTFPVRRGGSDRSAIRKALELLGSGCVVGIFPEGSRSESGEIMEPHMGAAMIALKGNVPILPVAVKGTRGFTGKIIISIGKSVTLDEYRDKKIEKKELIIISNKIMGNISMLLDNMN
jgi:1-acyl-sn-glycerol-3-phosphate acyltransferase